SASSLRFSRLLRQRRGVVEFHAVPYSPCDDHAGGARARRRIGRRRPKNRWMRHISPLRKPSIATCCSRATIACSSERGGSIFLCAGLNPVEYVGEIEN